MTRAFLHYLLFESNLVDRSFWPSLRTSFMNHSSDSSLRNDRLCNALMHYPNFFSYLMELASSPDILHTLLVQMINSYCDFLITDIELLRVVSLLKELGADTRRLMDCLSLNYLPDEVLVAMGLEDVLQGRLGISAAVRAVARESFLAQRAGHEARRFAILRSSDLAGSGAGRGAGSSPA